MRAVDCILAVDAGTENVTAGFPTLAVANVFSDYEELAFFANATWHVTPALELSFGARTSDNDQTATQTTDGPLAGGALMVIEGASSESPFTWSFSPRYKLNDDSSVYARIATGFRPGGPNILPPGAPAGTPASYDSDSLTSYEFGYKGSIADGKLALDVAAYFLDWDDVQLFTVVNGFGVNANGGTAESKGIEFAASLFPRDGLSISLNGAYTDAYLTQDTSAQVGGLDGDPLSYVPEWSFGVSADYEWEVWGDSTAYVGGSLHFRSSNKGGHNLMEPAVLGLAVLFGPYNYSFRETVRDLLQARAGLLVHDDAELVTTLAELLDAPQSRQDMGERARQVVIDNRGAARQNLALLRDYVSPGGVLPETQPNEGIHIQS